MDFPVSSVDQRTHRLIPSRFPPIAAFEDVTTADDVAAVMELEGWTNDRLVLERVQRLPRDRWVFGEPNASIVMAAFLHAASEGSRFNCRDLGAWYAAYRLETAVAEVAHHLRREAVFTGRTEMRLQYRQYLSNLNGEYTDICGQAEKRPDLYERGSYAASQVFGEEIRATGGSGIIYDSVRHRGGTNVVAFNPKNIQDVTSGTHFELIVPLSGRVIARTIQLA
jgi:hypothetical protein